MGLATKKILKLNITISPKLQVLEEIRKYLLITKNQEPRTKNKRINPLIIFTPNPEIITYVQKDPNFRKIVNSAQVNIPDGQGVCWAMEKIYGIKIERMCGSDLMLDLVRLSSQKGLRVGLIGGRGGVALQALECLKRQFANLKGWAMDGPEIKIHPDSIGTKFKIKEESDKNTSDGDPERPKGVEWDSSRRRHSLWRRTAEVGESEDRYFLALIKEIKRRKIDILFVGLGFPKQEYFIAQLAQTLHRELRTKNGNRSKDKFLVQGSKFSVPIVLMAVGGSFDYLAGRVPRAPKWIRDRGLEWLYRLISQPGRLSRQIKGLEFFYRVLTFSSSSSVEN